MLQVVYYEKALRF